MESRMEGQSVELAIQASTSQARLDAAKNYMSITDDATSMIELADQNWLQELSRLDMEWENIPHGNDLYAVREWVQTKYLPMQKRVHTKRVREEVVVNIQEEQVYYGSGRSFSVRIYTPCASHEFRRPALLMYHGGGFIHGNPLCDEDLSIFLASEIDAVIFSVDYCLAPESKFPLPFDDCYEALNWVLRNAEMKGVDASKIGLWGCSAGGNLAAAVALKDSQLHTPSRIRQLSLVVPVTCAPEAYNDNIKVLLDRRSAIDPKHLTFVQNISEIFAFYTESSAEFSKPFVSPLCSDPLPTHAPTHVTVAGRDGLRDEGIAYALHLRDRGVDVQLEILPGVPHGFTWATKSWCFSQFVRNQVRLFNVAFHTEF